MKSAVETAVNTTPPSTISAGTTPPVSPVAGDAPGAASLDQLRDIQLPDPIGIWPPAPGWWLLGLIISGAMVWLGITLRRHRLRNRYRRLALRELGQLAADQAAETSLTKASKQPSNLPATQQLNQILKRTALQGFAPTHYENSHDQAQALAALSGQSWLDFLYASSRIEAFNEPLGQRLATSLYQPGSDICGDELVQLQQLVKQWIKRHRRSRLKPKIQPKSTAKTVATPGPSSTQDNSRYQRPGSIIKQQQEEEVC
ncbi:MAG: DUF4381 domain-containing protein [Motiliproteus sp.]